MNSKFGIATICVLLFFSCAKEDEKTIFVNDIMVNCVGVSPQKCFQIRENESDPWYNHYGTIEGFEFEPGYSYKLKVRVAEVDNPAADQLSETFVLLDVLKKTKVEVDKSAMPIDQGSWLVTRVKDRTDFKRNPTLTVTLPQGQIQGSTSCNKFFGNVEIGSNTFRANKIASTKMMCDDMTIEQVFLENLNLVTSYKIENETLQLMSNDGKIAIECKHLKERE